MVALRSLVPFCIKGVEVDIRVIREVVPELIAQPVDRSMLLLYFLKT